MTNKVPVEYAMAVKFGWTPDQINQMSSADFDMYSAIMRAESKAGKLSEAQAKFYGK